jgi:peptidoglycan/LPS O-acetylase OafA/YrhL
MVKWNIFKTENRIFGLDLLRFLAIAYVLLGHSKILIPRAYEPVIDKLLLDGVSLFFVLSGFLIGGILIRMLKKNPPSFELLFTFWSRRWMRTLPIYILVLSFILIYTAYFKPQRIPENWWHYFLFIQNFNTPQPAFFSESWSLSIEEWFYLLTPLFVFPVIKWFNWSIKNAFLLLIFGGIIAVIGYRYYLYHSGVASTNDGYHEEITQQVLSRLDAIMFGVLGAFLYDFFPKMWKFFAHWILLVGGFLFLYGIKQYNQSYLSEYYVVWIPALKSIGVLVMLPFLSHWKTFTNPIAKLITGISLISYSMYLVNRTIVIEIIFKHLVNRNYSSKHIIPDTWLIEYIGFWVVTIGLSYLLFLFIEKPFMELRRKEK